MSEIKKQDRCPFCHGEMMHYDELGYVINLCKSGAFGRCDSSYSEQLSQHTGDLRRIFFRSTNYMYDIFARNMMLSVWLRYANRPRLLNIKADNINIFDLNKLDKKIKTLLVFF